MAEVKIPWSLRGQAKDDVASWSRSNLRRQRIRVPAIYKAIVFYTERPIRLCIGLSALGILYGLAIYLWLGVLDFTPGKPWSDSSEGTNHFTVLLAVQASIAALVYPIVIAFITIFLQRRPATQALLQLYIVDTGALVAGLASLGLVVTMSVEYLFLATIPPRALLALTGTSAAWFLCNVLLTTFFLFKTIDFLRSQAQRLAVHRYVAHVSLKRDVERAHIVNLFYGASGKGWFALPSGASDPPPSGPQIVVGGWFSRSAGSALTVSLKQPSVVSDIRLRVLNYALVSWRDEASRGGRSIGSSAHDEKSPTIELPIVVNDLCEGEVDLVKVSNGPSLTLFQRLLMSWSFVISSPRHDRYHVSTMDIIEELSSDLLVAISKRDRVAFRQSYAELVQLHTLLVDLCVVATPEDEGVASCAMLQVADSRLLNRTLHESWIQAYRPIVHEVVASIETEEDFFRQMCGFAYIVGRDGLRRSPLRLRSDLLSVPRALAHDLGEWWTNQVRDSGGPIAKSGSSLRLPGTPGRSYSSALRSFVSGWESTREYLVDFPEVDDFSWSAAYGFSDLAADHALSTARFLLSSISRGDVEAAEWFGDVFSKWTSAFRFDHEPISLYKKTDFITLSFLELPWQEVRTAVAIADGDLAIDQVSETKLQYAIAAAAVLNFWSDLRVVVVEMLLSWAMRSASASGSTSLAMEFATGLLEGRHWKNGGDDGRSSRMTQADLIESKIRVFGSSLGNSNVRGRFERFVEQIEDIERPPMIAGRTYLMPRSGLDSLRRSSVAMMIALSDQPWSLDDSVLREISAWLPARREDMDHVDYLCAQLVRQLDEHPSELLGVAEALSQSKPEAFEARKRMARAKVALKGFNAFLLRTRDESLNAVGIDSGRLRQIALYASADAFSAETGRFPLKLFRSISFGSGGLERYTLKMKGVRKGELTKDALEPRAVNEREYWSRTVANYVGVIVLRDLLRASSVEDRETPTATAYWELLLSEAARMRNRGRQPILILENATRPDWVWDWQHSGYSFSRPMPDGLRVTRYPNGRGDGYICDFNDIHVYGGALAAGQSILTSDELFATLQFQRNTDGTFVDVSASPDEEKKQLVDVSLSFSRRVVSGQTAVFRLLYGVPD